MITAEEAIANVGGLVRVHPAASNNASPHWGRARLVGLIGKEKALVRPFHRHRQDETVDLKHLKLWKAGALPKGM